MGERVHYSSIKFKKNLRRETAATQGEDVTYSEVKIINPVSSKAVGQSLLTENSAGSSDPYRRAAVCLGLQCFLLLAAASVLCVLCGECFIDGGFSTGVLDTSLSQTCSLSETHLEELRANNNTMKQERDQLQGNYTILKQERDQLQREYNIFQQAGSKKFPFIDQYCPYSSQKRECKPCPQGWEPFDYKCYYFSTKCMSWTESRIDCVKRGADLVIIGSEEEQDFISRNLKDHEYWIGLSDSVTEGTWLWVDGSPLQGGFWRRGEPDDRYWSYSGTRQYGADCAVTVQKEKTWMDTDCSWEHRFICETDVLLL